MKAKTYLILIVCVIGFGVLFYPSGKMDTPTPSQDPEFALQASKIKHVIRFDPGPFYRVGFVPKGATQPNRALADVIRNFEALYPDTKIEPITAPRKREYLVTQLSSGRAPDILNVNVEDVWPDIQKGWYLPLDPYLEKPNPFISEGEPGSKQWWDQFRYQSVSRGKAAPDGKHYCITYDLVETIIAYNKDMFDEIGAAPPETMTEMFATMQQFEQKGVIPLHTIIEIMRDWVTDVILDQVYYQILAGIDLYQDPNREEYLQGYLDWTEICELRERGFFTPSDLRFTECWRLLKMIGDYSNKDLYGVDHLRGFILEKIGNGLAFLSRSALASE